MTSYLQREQSANYHPKKVRPYTIAWQQPLPKHSLRGITNCLQPLPALCNAYSSWMRTLLPGYRAEVMGMFATGTTACYLHRNLIKQLTFGHIFCFLFFQLSGREFHHIRHNVGPHQHSAPKRPLFHHKDAEGRVQVDLLWELLQKNHTEEGLWRCGKYTESQN